MNIRKHIPNAITLANLLCGCLAIIVCFEGELVWASYLIGLAAVFDFFDGFAARLLKVSSPIGKDLDSLADMVTFGVVPGLMVYVIGKWANENYISFHHGGELPPYSEFIPYLGLIIPVFSAIRLANFNHDTRQAESFIGLPTPANAILVGSLPLMFLGQKDPHDWVYHSLIVEPYFLGVLPLLLSYLLIAPIPLFALKFKQFKWKENEMRYIFLGLSLIVLLSFQFTGIPLIILLYILLSIVNNIFLKNKV